MIYEDLAQYDDEIAALEQVLRVNPSRLEHAEFLEDIADSLAAVVAEREIAEKYLTR